MKDMQGRETMAQLRILSVSEQIAAHLKLEISQRRWTDLLPGRAALAKLYEVGITSMEQALRQLEREGILCSVGDGFGRRVADSSLMEDKKRLRIAILPYEESIRSPGIFSNVQHALREAGHDAFFIRSTLINLEMDVKRVARLVAQTEADAWILCAGPRDITEWFSRQPVPALALFGRRRGVPIASVGPEKSAATVEATRRLLEFGHRRIVMLVRPDRRRPAPGTPERAFLRTLEEHGVPAEIPYHLPDWDDGKEGFQSRLQQLFQVTPPTALIVDELMLHVATLQFLARKRLLVPEDVSMVCMEADSAFDWCRPEIAQIEWSHLPVIRRVVKWANTIARGKRDRREVRVHASFLEGKSIGPVRN